MSRPLAICCLIAAASPIFVENGRAEEPKIRKDAPKIPSLIRYGTSLLRHEQPVQAVALSPDGRFIASSARDFSVRIWDRTTGTQVHSLLTPTNRLAFGAPESSTPCLRYSPDGKYLVAGRGDSNLLVWETSEYKLLHKLGGSTGAIHALAIAPDSKTCASADSEQIVRLWNLAEGKETKQLTVQERANVLAFAPHGSHLLAGCNDGTVRIWQLEPISQVRVIEAHESPIQYLAFLPNGGVLGSAGLDKTVRFWDTRVEANPRVAPLGWAPIAGTPLSLFSSLFQGLHYAALDRVVDKLTCNEEPLRALIPLPGGTLLTGGADGIRIWNLQTHQEVRRIASAAITCAAADKLGQVAVTGDAHGVVRLWNLESAQEIVVAPGPIWQPGDIGMMPGSAKIAIAYRNGPVLLWDSAGEKNGAPLDSEKTPSRLSALAADGSLAAAVSATGIVVYELPSGKKSITIQTSEKNFTVLALNSRTHLLAAATEDKTLSIWSMTDGRLVQRIESLGSPLRTLLFTADGKTLAGCPGNDTLILWDASSGKEQRRLVESGADITAVALSADGSLAALGHPDGAVRIWRTRTGRLMHLLEGHPGPVRALAFSSDTRSLAAGSWLTLRLWEVATGKERIRLFDLPGEVTAATIVPGHEAAILGMSDTQALRVPLQPSDLEVKAWNASELEGLWRDLESMDAARAYRAMCSLAANAEVAIPLVRERLHALAPLDEAQRLRQARAFQKLDSPQFEEREHAAKELEQFADAAEPELRTALSQNPTSEMRFQLLALLEKLQTPERQRQRLRGLRCCEILERIATPESKSILRDLARGAPGVWLTVAAGSSLERLEKSSGSSIE